MSGDPEEAALNADGILSPRQVKILIEDPEFDMLPWGERVRRGAKKYGFPEPV